MIRGRVLHAGEVIGDTLTLGAPLSFWGGFDPNTGTIIDQAHPQAGASLTGRIVVMAGSRGSAGTPGVLAESLRQATGPAALIVTKADINLTAGAVVAAALYDHRFPIVLVSDSDFALLPDNARVELHLDGRIAFVD